MSSSIKSKPSNLNCSSRVMDKLAKFNELAKEICEENNSRELRIMISEPRPKEKLFLVYRFERNDFSLQWEDGVLLSSKLACKILPLALQIFLTTYKSISKRKLQII